MHEVLLLRFQKVVILHALHAYRRAYIYVTL